MLLTIIITKEKVYAHIKRHNEKNVLAYKQTSQDLGKVLDDVLKQVTNKGWAIKKPIPTAVILPFDSTGWQSQLEKFKTQRKADIRLVFEDDLARSYLKGAGKDIDHSDYIILRNEGEGSEMFFYKSQGVSQLVSLKEMNLETGYKKMRDYVVATFAKEGFVLGTDQEKQILEQIQQGGKGGTYNINKKTNQINIQASIHVSKEEFEDKTTEKRSILSKYMHPKILQSSPNLKEVILVGDYFNNQAVSNYLKNDLQLADKMKNDTVIDMETLVNYASIVGFKGSETYLAAEQAEENRISDLERKREAKRARISLLSEIRNTVIDSKKSEEYKAYFSKKAAELGVPNEVVMWNIEEIIDALELEEELKNKHEIEVVSTSDIEKVDNNISIKKTVTTTPAPSSPPVIKEVAPNPTPALKSEVKKSKPKVEVKKNEPTTAGKKENQPSPPQPKIIATAKTLSPQQELGNIFNTQRQVGHIGFHAQLGELKNEVGTQKLLRFITKDELKNNDAKSRFEQLHQAESRYYENLSPVHSENFGKYYYRNSLEGEPLSKYIKKNTRFKSDINKWSNNDLKFVLKIWKEVDNIGYNYDLDADDIIILTKRSLLKKEVDIKLVNFRERQVSEEKMENKMHKILGQLFGEKNYQQLRDKFTV